ncbi:MAG: hypothetical protein AB4050_14360 [Synechococcus sp.]
MTIANKQGFSIKSTVALRKDWGTRKTPVSGKCPVPGIGEVFPRKNSMVRINAGSNLAWESSPNQCLVHQSTYRGFHQFF